VPQPSAFEVERTIEKLKRNKPRGIDQIPAELFNEWSRNIRSEINKLTRRVGKVKIHHV